MIIMPNRQTHTFMDRVFFQKSYWKIHKLIDSAYFVVRRGHRKHHHNDLNALTIARNTYPRDFIVQKAAILHLILDEYCSNNLFIKELIENAAKEYYKKDKALPKGKQVQ